MTNNFSTRLHLWIPKELKAWMKQFQRKTGIDMTSQVKQAMLKYKRENDDL